MKESWKIIEITNGLYEVCNLGKVSRIGQRVARKNGTTVYVPSNVLSVKVGKKGYCTVNLTMNNRKKTQYLHRLVAMAFIPNPENKPDVNHLDGNKSNNLVSNLAWVTKSENSKHAFDTGLNRAYKGEKHNLAKLTNVEVLKIRKEHIPFVNTYPMLAKKYSVRPNTIRSIVKRYTWTHI